MGMLPWFYEVAVVSSCSYCNIKFSDFTGKIQSFALKEAITSSCGSFCHNSTEYLRPGLLMLGGKGL